MTSAAVHGLAAALVRLALRVDDDTPPHELDYAMGVVDDLTPSEKTALIRLQATLTARLIRRADKSVQPDLVATYERGL